MPVGCDCSEILPIRACQPYANHGDVTRALAALGQCRVGDVENTTDPVADPSGALAEAFPNGFNPNCPPDVIYIRRPDGAIYTSVNQGVSWTPVGASAGSPSSVRVDEVLNNSAQTLQTGDVVVWDFTQDRAVKVTTDDFDNQIAGVWVGTTLSSNTGMFVARGIAVVKVDSPVSRGDALIISSALDGYATPRVGDQAANSLIGYALENLGSPGSVLAFVDAHLFEVPDIRVRVMKSANQSISGDGTTSTITWDVEVYDTYNLHDNSSNTDRLTAPIDGVYSITLLIAVNSVTGDINTAIVKNGDDADILGGGATRDLIASGHKASSTVLVPLNAGDWVRARVRKSGAYAAGVTTRSYFEMKLERRL